MMHMTDSGLDLQSDPWAVLVLGVIACAIIWVLAAPYRRADRRERINHGVINDHVDPDDGDRAHLLGQPTHLRGHHASADRVGGSPDRDHRSSGCDHSSGAHPALDLTDDEIVALARWIEQDGPPDDRDLVALALSKLYGAAYDIVLADRAGRRR